MKIFRKLLINYKSKGLFETLKKIIFKFFDIIFLTDYKKKRSKNFFYPNKQLKKNSILFMIQIIGLMVKVDPEVAPTKKVLKV